MKTILSTLFVLLFTSQPLLAELTVVSEKTDDGELTIFRMTVTAAVEPTPALKHRLRLRAFEYKPGNAAMYYLKVNSSEIGLNTAWRRVRKKYGDEFDDWCDLDISTRDLPLERVHEASAVFDHYVDNFIRPASERSECDWGHDLAELRGRAVVEFLLPEMQESRSISRMLALRTRLATAEGRYDDAIDHMRMNYRLAQNVGNESLLLVCCLVGLAEQGATNQTLIDLIAAPDSPNLYWALSELPRPLVNMREAMVFEMSIGMRLFSVLIDAETAEHSPAEWARLIVENMKMAAEFDIGPRKPPGFATSLTATAMSLVFYPAAKQRLLRSGMDPKRVEQMAVGQVLAIDAAREYCRITDEMEKWAYVPYQVARQGSGESYEKIFKHNHQRYNFGQIIADILLPAIQAARAAEVRIQWETDAIRVVEALRMHAAETGQFPPTLADIRVVPVPNNPITLQPYVYRLRDETAVLELPFSDGMRGIAWRYELQLAE